MLTIGKRMAGRASIVLAVILAAGPALAEVSDKIDETRAEYGIVTGILLLITALAAASGGRRWLLLWPVTLIWGQIEFWTVWEWFDEIRRDESLSLLWESGAAVAALLLAPPLFAGLARRRHRAGYPLRRREL